ncbi:TonB-dependent receptor [bacterium]|nr:TonB-dependent receptor [bacterium]
MLFLLICTSSLFGAVIRGQVINQHTGEPLIGANIIVTGTKQGGSTDLDGFFFIPNLPKGKHEVRISMMGYESTIKMATLKNEEDEKELKIYLKEVSIQGEPVIITASKKEQKLQESPVSVTVAQADELNVNNAITMEDLMKNIAGVSMYDSQVSIRNSSGYAYGAGTRVLLLIDGVPALAGDTGEIKWDSLPIQQIERVEVVKSAGSALYGSNAMGGVINIITKEGDYKPSYSATMMLGMYDKPYYDEWKWTDRLQLYHHFGLEHSRKVGKTQMMLSFNEKMSDGYKQADDFVRGSSMGKFHYEHSPETNLTLFYNIAYEDRGCWFMWIDQNSPYEVDPRRLDDRVYSGKFNTYLKFNRKLFEKNLFYTMKVHYMYTRWFQDFMNGKEKDYSASGKLGVDSQFNFYQYDNNSIVFGIEGYYSNVNSKIFDKRFGMGGALFLQDEISYLHPLVITGGVRYDYSYVGNQSKWWQLTPKLGLVYHLNNNITFRGSGGMGFRTPTIAELFTETTLSGVIEVQPNPQLNPEAAQSIEFGVNYIYKNHYLDLAFFWNEYEDMIEAQIIDATEGIAKFANLDKARIRGVDFSAHTSYGMFSPSISYVYTEAKDLSNGEPLAYRPEHTVNLAMGIDYSSFGQFNVSYYYVSLLEKVGLFTGDPRVPVKLFNVGHKFKLGNFTVNTQVKNLFEYNYLVVERTMAEPRTYDISVTASF